MSRLLRVTGPSGLVLVALAALLIALAFNGGADAGRPGDPGATVRYGLPIATLMADLAAAAMIGSLVLACFALSPDEREYGSAIDFAAGSAAVMTIASAVAGFFTFLSISGLPVSTSRQFGDALGTFVTGVPVGQAWLAGTLIAAIVTVLCFAVRSQTAVAFVAIVAALSVLPRALQGYPPNTPAHDAAVTALGLYQVFVCIWFGALLTIAILRRRDNAQRIGRVAQRYPALAMVCFVVVAVSGYATAALRIGAPANLATPYGILVLISGAALVALAVLVLLRRQLVAAQLALMGIVFGVAVALTRIAGPVSQTPPTAGTPAEILTGSPLPPAANVQRYLAGFSPDLIWLLICGFGLFFYCAAVWRLRRRGEPWPPHRTVLWIAGILLLFLLTNGGISEYQDYLFSAHMLGHAALIMLVPLLLVPGAPVTLILCGSTERADASRGPREWTGLIVHSRIAGFLTNPIVTLVLVIAALWVFYYTPLLRWATADLIGRETMIVVFLLAGSLFVQSLIGIDPVSYRLPYPFRMLLIGCAMAFLAVFGISLAGGNSLLLADWFGAMGRTWGPGAVADQQAGGWSVLAVGALWALITLSVVTTQGVRHRAQRH